MKSTSMNATGLLKALSLVIAAAAGPANAAILSSSLVSDDPLFYDSAITPSLITAGQPSLVSLTGTIPSANFALGGVNNGSAVGFNLPNDRTTLTFYENLAATPATLTFQLNQGYTLSRISSLAGWGDSYFGSQLFSVQLEIGSSGIFNSIGNFGQTPYTPTAPAGFPEVADSGFSVLTSITDDTGTIASNVTGVRFLFTDPYPTIPSLNGTVIRELSVVGTVTVPEPSAIGLAALAGIAACARRRRA